MAPVLSRSGRRSHAPSNGSAPLHSISAWAGGPSPWAERAGSPRVGSPVLARRAQWIALAGALMFAASDGLLAVKHFVRPLPGA
ncbi:lysoplasmalogenase family protein, partial [Pyxidicoccus caerfyrddinensis]|uniref:lysoplasmalogenase family protein n=1 Tax=Pyxidicoccus caerfyrddinensis TaxID=2709663 RepID=UPI0023DE182F